MNILIAVLSKALGTSNAGTKHFAAQRITALVLIPLVVWFCLSLAFLPDANYTTVITWLSSPFNAILMFITIFIGLQHGALGIETILEDYISTSNTQKNIIMIIKLLLFFFALLGTASVVKISFLS